MQVGRYVLKTGWVVSDSVSVHTATFRKRK